MATSLCSRYFEKSSPTSSSRAGVPLEYMCLALIMKARWKRNSDQQFFHSASDPLCSTPNPVYMADSWCKSDLDKAWLKKVYPRATVYNKIKTASATSTDHLTVHHSQLKRCSISPPTACDYSVTQSFALDESSVDLSHFSVRLVSRSFHVAGCCAGMSNVDNDAVQGSGLDVPARSW